jgi:hypothetical protein
VIFAIKISLLREHKFLFAACCGKEHRAERHAGHSRRAQRTVLRGNFIPLSSIISPAQNKYQQLLSGTHRRVCLFIYDSNFASFSSNRSAFCLSLS